MQAYRLLVYLIHLPCRVSVITLHTIINPYFSLLKINICMFPFHDSMNMYKVSWCVSIQYRKNISAKKNIQMRNASVYTAPCIFSIFVLYNYLISVLTQQILIFYYLKLI